MELRQTASTSHRAARRCERVEGACEQEGEMVRLEGETSNSLFETLEDWNAYLKAEKIEFPQRENPSRQPSRRGPSL